jgi:hypothetical protein
MSARLGLTGLAAVALAASAPGAQAKTERIALADFLVDGPVLVDGTALWMEIGGAQVKAAKPGRSPRIVASKALPADFEDEDQGDFRSSGGEAFSASASHVLIDSRVTNGSSKYFQYNYDYTTTAFARGARVGRALGSCSFHVDNFNGPGATVTPPRSALDGTTAAAWSCPRAYVIDVTTGQKLRELPTLGAEPRIAGRYVASRVRRPMDSDQIIVYDWQAGAEAYRITLAGQGDAAFDLQADGSVAVVQFSGAPACNTGGLSWHTSAEPAGRPLPIAPCAAAVAIDGGKAAVVAEAPSQAPAQSFVVAEIGSDGTRRDLGWLGSGHRRVGEIDYVGGTAAYALRGCTGSVAIMSASGPPESRPLDCLFPRISSASLTGRTLRVTGTTNPAFEGPLAVSYRLRVGRRAFRVRRSVAAAAGRFAAVLRAPGGVRSPRAARRGRLRVSYAGDDVFQPASASRLLATPRPRGR